MYLYKTILFRDTTNVIDSPATNPVDLLDFDTNHKASCLFINQLEIAETTVLIEKTYTQLNALIANPILWSDIKYKSNSQKYELFLLSENPL